MEELRKRAHSINRDYMFSVSLLYLVIIINGITRLFGKNVETPVIWVASFAVLVGIIGLIVNPIAFFRNKRHIQEATLEDAVKAEAQVD